jgi:hypothetical protein
MWLRDMLLNSSTRSAASHTVFGIQTNSWLLLGIQLTLVIVLYGIYGLYNLGEQRRTAPRVLSYCGLMGVGVCSAGYHMTLKYHTQMCTISPILPDEGNPCTG